MNESPVSSFERATARRRFALLLLLVGLCFAALMSAGCARPEPPPLIEVTSLVPKQIEAGERFELLGSGFPQGRAGLVTLEGSIHRPGEAKTRFVRVDVEGMVLTPDRLEIVARDAFVERFCGHGDRAGHATFRGDARVSFASSTPGAPPLVGVLRGVVLDLIPATTRASVLDARTAEGSRVLDFLGIAPGAPTSRGLPIEKVRPESMAARSRLQVGDVLVSMDGLNILSRADVVPASARAVELEIRHGDTGMHETVSFSLLAYSGERIPTEYVPALVVVGLALALLVILGLPSPAPLAALEVRIASKLRRRSLRAVLGSLFGTGHQFLASALASAVVATFALTPYVVGREADGVALLALCAILLVWSRVTVAVGFVASLRALLRSMPAVFVMSVALALAIAQVGAIELAEIVRLQGAAPWQFTAAKHPACAILTVVFVVSMTSILRLREPAEASSANPTVAPRPPSVRASILERCGVLFGSALLVTTFFGGWRLPFVVEPRGYALLLACAMYFVAKTWVMAALVLGVSRLSSSLGPREVRVLVLLKLVPALLLTTALVVASRQIVPSAALELAFGCSLVALGALLLVRVASRVWTALTQPEPHASPFF